MKGAHTLMAGQQAAPRPAAAAAAPRPSPHTALLRPTAPRTRLPTAVVCASATRAPSAYNLFTKAKYGPVREELKAKGEEAKLAQCTGKIREMWAGLSEKDKEPFTREANKLKEQVAATK